MHIKKKLNSNKRIYLIIRIFIYPLFFLFNHVSFRTVLPKKIRRIIDFTRTNLLSLMGVKIGRHVFISKNFFTTSFDNLRLGSNGTIGMNCQLYSYGEGITIGDDFLIGSDFTVHTSEHNYLDSNIPFINQGAEYLKVVIGSNVYIGSGVTILSGVKIDDNVIVAAGSVVNKDLESGWIYGGVPAVKLKIIESIQL